MGSLSKGVVWLFKTPLAAGLDDAYASTLRDAGYKCRYIPVLQEVFRTAELETVLCEGDHWDGIIITSKRGAEGWVRSAANVIDAGARNIRDGEVPRLAVCA